MSANVEEERLPLSEQLDKLPESELVQKVRQDFYRTGTCRLEDLYRILGDASRAIRVVVQEDSVSTCGEVLGRAANR
jgi:hypothetical protein